MLSWKILTASKSYLTARGPQVWIKRWKRAGLTIMQCLKALKLLRTVQARTERAEPPPSTRERCCHYLMLRRNWLLTLKWTLGRKEYCLILLALYVGICFKCGSFLTEKKNNKSRVIPVSKARFIDTHSTAHCFTSWLLHSFNVCKGKNTELCFCYLSRTNQTRWWCRHAWNRREWPCKSWRCSCW